MAHNNLNKFYPAASEEMAKMLGLTDKAPATPVSTAQLPIAAEIVPATAATPEDVIARDIEAITGKKPVQTEAPVKEVAATTFSAAVKGLGKVAIAIVPYVLVFAVGLFAYYAWFADASNRPDIFKIFERQTQTTEDSRVDAFEELKQDEADAYAKWISGFYYNVTDASLVAVDYVGPNKLTNFENYLLKLNPTTNDVRGTGTSDADFILKGIDPITGNALSDESRDIIAQYFDVTAIANRIAGPVTSARVIITPRVAQAQTSTLNGSAAPIKPGPSIDTCAENRLKINTTIPGRLEVPLMDVNVPIIWTRDAKNFDEDLKTGVVHYPCTPLPGDIGTSYISGHSSNYAWVKADFNKVFAKMGDLPDGATFKITVVGADGKDIKLHYVVQRKQVFASNDQAQFVNTADSIVALSTCWPLNTIEKRMVAFGKLDRVE